MKSLANRPHRNFVALFLTAALLVLAAASEADARRSRNALTGAAIGGGVGALVGGLRGAGTGAAIGAIVGAVR